MDMHIILLLLFVCSLLLGHNNVGGVQGLSKTEDFELEKQLKLLNKPAVKTIYTRRGDIIDCVDFYKQPAFDHPLLKNHTFHYQYAVARTRINSNNKFIGAGAGISTLNPLVVDRQYSGARVKIQNGPDSIETGWRVDPSLYGDSQPRQFVRLDAGQSHCFNTRCPGFVIVRSDMPLDMVLTEISQRGGQSFIFPTYIVRDQINGNWWLEVGPDYTEVGFWPKQLFTGLGDLANYVEWGGEVFSPTGTREPPMGWGSFPIGTPLYDAFFEHASVLNEFGQTVDAYDTEGFADNDGLYKVLDIGNKKDLGHLVLYGGPGGSTQV